MRYESSSGEDSDASDCQADIILLSDVRLPWVVRFHCFCVALFLWFDCRVFMCQTSGM